MTSVVITGRRMNSSGTLMAQLLKKRKAKIEKAESGE
jgi:hypothetical protein